MPDESTRGHAETLGLAPDFLALLRCPLGKAELEVRDGALVCTRCGPAFRVEDGIPILLIDDAKLPEGVESAADLPCQREES